MKELKLQARQNSLYLKILYTGGILFLGVIGGYLLTIHKYSIPLNTKLLLIMGSNAFLWLGLAIAHAKQYLTINESGLFIDRGPRREYSFTFKSEWSAIKSISLYRRNILVKNNNGYTKKIRLPLYSDEQWKELQDYLVRACREKAVRFK